MINPRQTRPSVNSGQSRGFTLIELLVVIGIIAVLASIVVLAINPTKQLGDARNAQRRSDIKQLGNAIFQYQIDRNGNLPNSIDGTVRPICQFNAPNTGLATGCTGTLLGGLRGVNLNALVDTYIVNIPKDPLLTTTGTGTRYNIVKDPVTSRLTISAPAAEGGVSITLTR